MTNKNGNQESLDKNTKEELLRTQLFLKASLNGPNDIIIRSINNNFELLFMNNAYIEAFKKTYGVNIDAGMNLLDSIPIEADKEKTMINFNRALSGEYHKTVNEYGDSERSYYENSFYPIIDDTGKVIGATAFSRNITEQKRAEEVLQESQTRWRALSDNLPIGLVYQIDSGINGEQRRFSYISGGVVELHEISADEAMADPWTIYGQVDPEYLQEVVKAETHALNTGTPIRIEVRLHLPSGKTRWSLFTSSPRRLPNQHLVWDGIEIDITELKVAEEALRLSEHNARTILESISDAFFSMDSNLVVTYFNRAAEKLLNRKASEVLGHYLFDAFPEAKGSVFDDKYHQALCEKIALNFEVYFDVAPYQNWYDVRVYPQENGISVYFQVVTIRKRLEEELQKSQKLESLGFLAGGIAHDFNNLLGGIYGYMDMASEIATNHKLRQYISKAMNTIDRGRHLTQQLLTFAKGGAPIKSRGNLFPHLREVAQFALSGSNISCSFDISDNLHACSFDKNQIAQVIDNIMINAKQAMPDGGKIEVSAQNITIDSGQHASLGKGDYVQISIRDHGIGMPKEILPRIFDPFYTTKTTGHGLGLATCYSIIKRHEGFIDVESEPGKGSTFYIYIPSAGDYSDVSEEGAKGTHKGSGTFILMDDEEVMRETIASMLDSFGYNVIGVEDGQEALDILSSEIAEKREIAALMLDLTIPGGMGGREAINKIRDISTKIPVFVASGYAEDPVMANPREYGFIASICKPFRRIELSELLNKHLSRKE